MTQFKRACYSRILALCFLLFVPSQSQAQTVVGRVLAQEDGRPVSAVLVTLRDTTGRLQASHLTGVDGRFLFATGTLRQFILRAERIGYETISSPLLTATGATVNHDLQVLTRPVSLAALRVESDNRGCRPNVEGEAVQRLWDEIRKAITIAKWTQDQFAVHFATVLHVREMDPDMRLVYREQRSVREGIATTPFATASPADLATHGFLRSAGRERTLLAPDAGVLLSDEFLEFNCFRIVRADSAHLVGLSFEPIRRRRGVTEIKGVLAVDRRTAELRRLNYEYTNLPDDLAAFGATGQLRFEHIEDGRWVVRDWWIRSPIVNSTLRFDGTVRDVLAGTREDGGSVLTGNSAVDSAIVAAGLVVLRGVVTDSVSGRPMQDAHVLLSGTAFAGRTNAEGHYRIAGMPPDRYGIAVTTDLLSDLRFPMQLDTIQLVAPGVIVRNLATPSTTTLLRTICPGEEEENLPNSRGLVYGTVFGLTGEPLAGAEVRASWSGATSERSPSVNQWRTAKTGSDGRYYLCWLPEQSNLTLRVAPRDLPPASVNLRDTKVLRHDFR